MLDIVRLGDARQKMLADARRMASSANRDEALFGCDILQEIGDASDQMLAFRTRRNFFFQKKPRFSAWFNVLHGELLITSTLCAVAIVFIVMFLS